MNSNAYMASYMNERYRQRRAHAVAALGGQCAFCGSAENLELDHINPATKSLDLGHMWSVSIARYHAELVKCQALCRDCHKQKSASERSVEHGGGVSGKKNCKCRPCRARKSEYNRRYKAAKASA